MGHLMKHFIGAAVLVVLALVVRYCLLQQFALDVHVHDRYFVIPLRIIAFWFLMGLAAAWFVIAAWKSGRA